MSLKLAIKYAKLNPFVNKFKMACIITDGVRFFVGHNKLKTHPLAKRFSKSEMKLNCHCELSALVQASRSGIVPDRATVYVARVLKNGTPALAKPCGPCLTMLTEFGFNQVEWTTDHD